MHCQTYSGREQKAEVGVSRAYTIMGPSSLGLLSNQMVEKLLKTFCQFSATGSLSVNSVIDS